MPLIQHINIPIRNRERTREWYAKVLGAEFLDRGAARNARQLQLQIGSGEIHTTHTPHPTPSGHFAVEMHDWDAMIATLDALGVPYTPPTIRAYSGGHSTYIQDPDGNRIELVHHPLGLQDSQGKAVELVHDPHSLTWARCPFHKFAASQAATRLYGLGGYKARSNGLGRELNQARL